MKTLLTLLAALTIVLVAGASSASDRDLIIRLQGEVIVLQRQLRDLQETIDRNHEAIHPRILSLAEQSQNASTTLSTIADQFSQVSAVRQNNNRGLDGRLNQIEGRLNDTHDAIKALSEEIRQLKTSIDKSGSARP